MRDSPWLRAVALGGVVTLAAWLTLPCFADTTPQAPARSAGCGKPGGAGTLSRSALDGDRTRRTALVQLPAGYDATRAYAIVFVFHGSGGNSAQSRSWGLQNAAGAAADALFVFPDGIPFQREGIGWDDRNEGRDLPLFDHLLAGLEADFCIDGRQVYVAGFSWGGDFATALACNRGGVIRAIAVNSSTDEFANPTDFHTYRDLPCPAGPHPPIRFEHAQGGDREYPPPDFATTSKLFQYLNACRSDSTPAPSSTPVMACVTYSGCASEYVECSFDHELGHGLPPNWAADTWAFFRRYGQSVLPEARQR